MAKSRSRPPLKVYLNGSELGILEIHKSKNMIFKYAENWLRRDNSFPISRLFPLQENSFEGSLVYAYFDNLLPDSISIRQRVAATMKADSDHVFDLLTVIGRDCVGALQFINNESEIPKLQKARGKKLSKSQIGGILKSLKKTPLAVSDKENFRLSIAGVQEKTALLKIKNQWFLPQYESPTTHIFKPQIFELQKGIKFPYSVENEWLCSRILKAFGIPTANCEIQEFDEVQALVVERFDRSWLNNEILIRIPQEDMCQAMGVPSFKKYQSDGGPGIIDIMNLLNESENREKDRKIFLKTQFIFLLISAIDGHAKNYSIRWGPQGFTMAPLYDILSAQILLEQGAFEENKTKMALSFGDKNYYRLKDIFRRHIIQTAKSCRINEKVITDIIDEVLSEVPTVISKVNSELPNHFPEIVAEMILGSLKKRSKRFCSDSK